MSTVPRFALVPASYVYLQQGSQVLLQCRANTGYMDGHWVAGAAGHVEPGETAAAAAVREAREELGVEIDESQLRLLTVMHRTDGSADAVEQRVDWFWSAATWSGDPQVMESAKCAGIAWYDLASLPDPVSPYERIVLEAWRDGSLPATLSYGFDT